MAMTSSQVSVTTAATALATPSSITEVTLKNTHANEAVFLGDSAVTTATGLSLAAGATIGLLVDGGIYGICVTGPITVHVLRRT